MLQAIKILNAHGLDGSVHFFQFNPIAVGSVLTDRQNRNFTVKKINLDKKTIKFSEITDRTAAENLKSTILYMPKENLSDGQFYLSDLKGKKITVIGVDDKLAIIKNVLNFGAGDIIELEYEENIVLIPFRNQFFADDLSINIETINAFL